METNQISFSQTLYDVATECALRRFHKDCRHQFDSVACKNCSFYIKKYIDADPRHVELFMLQAGTRAYNLWRSGKEAHPIFIGAIIICLLLAAYYYKIEYDVFPFTSSNSAPIDKPIKVDTQSVQESITFALSKVSVDLGKNIDVNKDGEVNCQDAAIRFYQYFPDKSKVCIEWNYNEKTGMNHLFNCVFIGGVWRAIEPQAYYKNWSSYYMRDVWGSQYDSSFNQDVTKQFLKFVK